ncbi:MAG: hypothetical protein IT442_07765 [Phycisphaeraceae bacterium]|nr:hypothetical protein [Phycisphaeraceae bacterium]
MALKTTSGSHGPSTPNFHRLMARLGKAFDKAAIPYMVIGGQAVIHHGRSRYTQDIDLTLGISPFEAENVMALLAKMNIQPVAEDPHEFVRMTHVLPSMSAMLDLRVDFSFTDSPYELQAIARGEDVVLAGTPVRFATAEDLVVHKIIAGRPIDHQDVMGVLLKNPGLDADYVRHWLGQFGQALERPLIQEFERMWELSKK